MRRDQDRLAAAWPGAKGDVAHARAGDRRQARRMAAGKIVAHVRRITDRRDLRDETLAHRVIGD
jgi:hypothetical protein